MRVHVCDYICTHIICIQIISDFVWVTVRLANLKSILIAKMLRIENDSVVRRVQ